MVGGIVIGLSRKDGETLLNIQGVREESKDPTVAVRCKEYRIDNGQPINIQIGDSVWWHGRQLMWTPKEHTGQPVITEDDGTVLGCGKLWDVQLPRIGYSH